MYWRVKLMCENDISLVPGSPLKQVGGPLENKAELIALTIGDDNILHLSHDRVCTPGHQAQSPAIIGLCELVLLWKPKTTTTTTKVRLLMMHQPIYSQHNSNEKGNSLVEVASIQSHNNVTVSQTTVIRLKAADVLKLTLGHAGTSEKTS